MQVDLTLLLLNAAAIAVIHTLVGPDHYLPFIVLSKARGWSRAKTAWITLACGLAHVGSSIVIGLIGYALGASLKHLNLMEEIRGEIAAWLLIGFGLIYAAWGLRRARRTGPDGHIHAHGGFIHAADHVHDPKTGETINLTPWILFIVFAFGPCEPLIPLFIYPAATSGWVSAFAVAAVFTAATLAVMLSVVLASSFGLERIPLRTWGRYSHALAGASIAITGGAIQVFGL
jgi:sulfite exporter TauE/SafE